MPNPNILEVEIFFTERGTLVKIPRNFYRNIDRLNNYVIHITCYIHSTLFETYERVRRERQEVEEDYWQSYFDSIREEAFAEAINQVDRENAEMDIEIDNHFAELS